MPFLNNDNKPSFLNKQTPNISQRGIDKKPIFPKPQIPNFERDLDKNTRFLEELASSKMLLTSPGLTTSFEAFSFEIPTFFLPPQNYSQYWNLSKFNKHGLVFKDTNWSSIFPDLKILQNEPEEDGVKKVLEAIHRFDNNQLAQKKISDSLAQILEVKESQKRAIQSKQKKYFEYIGGNGTKKISGTLKKFLGENE